QLLDTKLRLCARPADGCHVCLGPWVSVQAPAGAARAFRSLEQSLPGTPARWLRRAVQSVAASTASPGGAADVERARLDHMRALLPLVDRFLAPSESVRDRFIEFGLPEEQITPWRLGFELPASSAVPRSDRARPSAPIRLGFLGSMMV